MKKSLVKLDKNFSSTQVADDLIWHDVRDLEIEGQGWTDKEHPFDRLPVRAKNIVRAPVWELSHHSAGIAARFVTNATQLSASWTLRFSRLTMPHMPASGASGLDLYAKENGRWLWVGTGIPQEFPVNRSSLAGNLVPKKLEFILYLPLYNGVEHVSIGLPDGAKMWPAPRRKLKHHQGVVFYGTSIVQGGCAARSGMGYPAILGRNLDCHITNLGFSGNGPMDLEFVPLLAELDPAVYVLDCLPNMRPQQVEERTEAFVQHLRKEKPNTPIVLVENIIYPSSALQRMENQPYREKNFVLRKKYKQMLKNGLSELYYVPAKQLLGNDNLGTVDGTHPTDVGFLRIAKALQPTIQRLLV